ncbi:MAG TPA: helix-turn-helix transcriptional regulator [Rugosimonospora sp.]|nr:helix-turn-helix transcriptional regulator [Rugosimonospora sp.]
MPRRHSVDTTIGENIRTRRQARSWSIRHAADRAGLAHSTWSRIEKGDMGVDNRFTLAAIAEALGCSTADLTGRPPITTDGELLAAQGAVAAILNVLVETDLAEAPTVQPRPLPEVARDAELVWDLRLRCDYSGAARLLAPVLRELHAHTAGPDRREALRLLVRTADATSFVVRYLGYPGEAWLASDRAHDAAVALEDPVMLGLSAWSLGHAATGCGAYGRALRIAERAVADLDPRMTVDDAPEMLGELMMLAGFAHLAQGHREEASHWAGEAATIAARTGDVPTLGLNWGPTGLNIWQISMEVDGGDPGKAVELARATNPAVVTVSRQVALYSDTGRALTRLGKDDEAVRMLVAAERIAPQRVRASRLVQETTRTLLERAQRRAGGSELRGLCERMGLSV